MSLYQATAAATVGPSATSTQIISSQAPAIIMPLDMQPLSEQNSAPLSPVMFASQDSMVRGAPFVCKRHCCYTTILILQFNNAPLYCFNPIVGA